MELNDIRMSLWVEKYRPLFLKDIILPEKTKAIFINLLAKKEVPNLLLYGSTGNGKTTVAKVFSQEIKANNLFINASIETGIDVLRNKVENFASTVSLNSDVQKIIILDEIENFSIAAITALRGFIETFSSNARFIITTNNINKIPDPIQSRMQTIEFEWDQEEKKKMMKDFFNKVLFILKSENISINDAGKRALAEFIKKLFPNMRKIIGEVQLFSRIDGTINEGLLYMLDEKKYEDLYKNMKDKSFPKMREWIANNMPGSANLFYDQLLNDLDTVFVPKSVPEAILIIDDYITKDANHWNKSIHATACILMLSANCEFK